MSTTATPQTPTTAGKGETPDIALRMADCLEQLAQQIRAAAKKPNRLNVGHALHDVAYELRTRSAECAAIGDGILAACGMCGESDCSCSAELNGDQSEPLESA